MSLVHRHWSCPGLNQGFRRRVGRRGDQRRWEPCAFRGFLATKCANGVRKSVQTRDGDGGGANFGVTRACFTPTRGADADGTIRAGPAGVHTQVHRSRPRLRVPLTGEVLTPGMTPGMGITYAAVGKEIATVLRRLAYPLLRP